MRLVPSAGTEYAKEMAKWEVRRPFSAYPKMLYRTQQLPNGKWSTGETNDALFGVHPGVAERWTSKCQLEVHNEQEERAKFDEGWRETPKEAMEHRERLERAIGDAAAFRAHEDRNMSEKAKEEAKAVEAEEFGHVAEIPQKRTGRPPLSPEERAKRDRKKLEDLAKVGLIAKSEHRRTLDPNDPNFIEPKPEPEVINPLEAS